MVTRTANLLHGLLREAWLHSTRRSVQEGPGAGEQEGETASTRGCCGLCA